jgi:hypothetical protein
MFESEISCNLLTASSIYRKKFSKVRLPNWEEFDIKVYENVTKRVREIRLRCLWGGV